MAFPSTRRSEVASLGVGDGLFAYTTRGCFKNPTRDRGRIIGHAMVAADVRALGEPVTFAGREFARGCRVALDSLAPLGEGVELAPLARSLRSFPVEGAGWAMRLRRPLVRLDDADIRELESQLAAVAGTPPNPTDISAYSRWWDGASSTHASAGPRA